MKPQSLTPLKGGLSSKSKEVVYELGHLQSIKKEQSKQMASEIKALTVKRNFLLKQIKELYVVVEDLKYKRNKITKFIDNYTKSRMKQIGAVGGLKVKVIPTTDIDPSGIMK